MTDTNDRGRAVTADSCKDMSLPADNVPDANATHAHRSGHDMSLWCETCDNRTANDGNDRAKGRKWIISVPKATASAAFFALWPRFSRHCATTCPPLCIHAASTTIFALFDYRQVDAALRAACSGSTARITATCSGQTKSAKIEINLYALESSP